MLSPLGGSFVMVEIGIPLRLPCSAGFTESSYLLAVVLPTAFILWLRMPFVSRVSLQYYHQVVLNTIQWPTCARSVVL
jgi:hypothetical protein